MKGEGGMQAEITFLALPWLAMSQPFGLGLGADFLTAQGVCPAMVSHVACAFQPELYAQCSA